MIDNRSYTHNLSIREFFSLKKRSGLNGFEPMTSAMLVHCFTNWAITVNWKLVTLWVRNIPVDGEE